MTIPIGSDRLSDAALAVLRAGGDEAYARLVVTSDGGRSDLRRQLVALKPENVLAAPVRSREDAEALLAGLWLWHDFLDESHTISQGLASPTGSFWHAIMHRREGDFSNAKYWYARCRRHPAMEELARAEQCNPDTFVDLVERVHHDPRDPRHAEAVRMQRIEWEALFRHCLRAASGN